MREQAELVQCAETLREMYDEFTQSVQDLGNKAKGRSTAGNKMGNSFLHWIGGSHIRTDRDRLCEEFLEKVQAQLELIRTALEGGDVPAANAMLGMPYAIRFAVQHGAGLGHTLGVPTINQIYPAGFQMPRYGIYITRTRIGDTWYPSATGLGTRPTVNSDETKVTCETFIPDFSGDLYGTDPVVEFYAYLSPSKKFDTLDELKACIDHAARRAKAYFAKA